MQNSYFALPYTFSLLTEHLTEMHIMLKGKNNICESQK